MGTPGSARSQVHSLLTIHDSRLSNLRGECRRCKMRMGSRPDSRCGRKKRAYSMVRTARRGKSGLHRVGWRLITARREARNRATETSPVEARAPDFAAARWQSPAKMDRRPQGRLFRARDQDGGETRQPPPGATPNRRAMTRPAELAGRWLELRSDPGPRGMAVHDRTRLIGQLRFLLPPVGM